MVVSDTKVVCISKTHRDDKRKKKKVLSYCLKSI